MWVKRMIMWLLAALMVVMVAPIVLAMIERERQPEPSQELAALEGLWAEWEPPPPIPLLCWMGTAVNHDYPCPEDKVFALVKGHARLVSNYIRVNPQNPIYLKWPVDGPGSVTDFGDRFHPVLNKWTHHDGMDEPCAVGDPIYAAGEGKVVFAGWNGKTKTSGYGWYVEIHHGQDDRGDNHHSRYGHLSKLVVQTGDVVEPGDIVGECGSTGMSTGPHLHFESRIEGKPVDPYTMLPR